MILPKIHILILAAIVVLTMVIGPAAAAGKDINKVDVDSTGKIFGFPVYYENGTSEMYYGPVLEDAVEWFDGPQYFKMLATYEAEFVGEESGAILDGDVRRNEHNLDNGQRMYKWDVHGVVTFPDGSTRKYHSVYHATLIEKNTVLNHFIEHYNWAR